MTGGCPVCGARFRGSRVCSRCGADLSAVMYLRAKAHRLRERARERLLSDDARAAAELVRSAQNLAPAIAGQRLERLARWLSEPNLSVVSERPHRIDGETERGHGEEG